MFQNKKFWNDMQNRLTEKENSEMVQVNKISQYCPTANQYQNQNSWPINWINANVQSAMPSLTCYLLVPIQPQGHTINI